MKLFPFLLINLAAFAILHFAWIPSTERRLHIDRSMATIRRAALLSLLGFARSVFLVTTLTSAALVLIILILQMMGGVTTVEVTSAIERIYRWRMLLLSIGPWWGGLTTVLLVLALGIYARRSGKLRMEKTFQKMYARKLEQLKKDYELGNLKEMPPTREMLEVTAKIVEIRKMLSSLEREDLLNDPEANALRQQLIGQMDMLQRYYFALDVQRRVDLELDPDEAALPEARTRWEKLQTFFMSRGLLASLNKTSRALFIASLILLVPSLTGIYSLSIATTLNNRLVQLQDLRVELSRKEFEQQKALLGKPTNDLSEKDKQGLQEVARAYEQIATPVMISPSMRIPMYTMRSMLVREGVLASTTRQANAVREQYATSAVWEQHASGSKVQGLTPLEREVVIMPEKAVHTRGPVTPQGQRVYAELEDIARRSPSFMDKVRNGLHAFQRPASSYDISYSLFNQMASTLAGETSVEFGNVLRGIGTDSRFAGFTEIQSKQFLFDLMRGTSVDEALNHTAATDFKDAFISPREKLQFHSTMRTATDNLPLTSINEKLADYPPGIDIAPEKHVNIQKATEAVNSYRNKVVSILPMRGSEVYADSVATFSDWFPAQLGSEARTRRGELLAKWASESPEINLPRPPNDIDPPSGTGGLPSGGGPGTGGGGIGAGNGGTSPKPRLPAPSVSRTSFARARSFGGLRGFSRVGGVLIGQTPTDAATAKPNFVDLRWEINDSQVRFILVSKDGQQIRSRPYRMSIAYQALNYAADGRPLAVTMVSAAPLRELKILLHPTLVDSPLGHRVIELDRFVDIYTGRDSKAKEAYETRKKATERLYLHHALYTFAWANRALAFFDAMAEVVSDSKLSSTQQYLRHEIADEALRELAAKALDESLSIRDPQESPLTVKKEFYDQTLVEILIGLKPGTTLDSLSTSIQYRAGQEVRALIASRNEEHFEALFQRWMSPPPEFVVWSGVREHDFDANSANILVSEGAEIPMPFDFMLQVAFTSPPAFMDEASAENYTDTQPWEFPSLRETIHNTVVREIGKDKSGRAQSIVADVSEFTMLQRLFRMAFNGNLGEDFPIEKMMELSQALAGRAPKKVTRTLRWNAFVVDPIAAQLRGARGEDRELLTLMQEIRQSLGVAIDGEQSRREDKAPLPPLD